MDHGDTIFCLATGVVDAPYDAVEAIAAAAVEAVAADVVARSIVDGVRR